MPAITRRTFVAGTIAAIAVPVALTSSPALSAEFEVHMQNKGTDGSAMAFEPPLTRIAVGDTVKFIPVDPGHNAETIRGMLPDGAEPIKGAIGKEVDVTFTVPGVYGIKCLPHYPMGMVALIVVGDPAPNLAAAMAVTNPPMAKKRLDPLFAELTTPQ